VHPPRPAGRADVAELPPEDGQAQAEPERGIMLGQGGAPTGSTARSTERMRRLLPPGGMYPSVATTRG
jgi:hypothetical protein